MIKNFIVGLMAISLGLFSSQSMAQDKADPSTQVGVRLLTHFSKTMTDDGWGVGGWIIMPDVVKMGATPLWLIGPRYKGDGWWLETMLGGLSIAADPDPKNAGFSKTMMVQSNRFQITPKALGAPVNVFGNLQFIDVGGEHFATEEDTMKVYTFLMVGYAFPEKNAIIGVETENYFNTFTTVGDNGKLDKFNDVAFGPNIVLPFNGLNIIMSYQLHTHEDVENQMWIRAMYNFGGPKTGKKKG